MNDVCWFRLQGFKTNENGDKVAFNTMIYSEPEVVHSLQVPDSCYKAAVIIRHYIVLSCPAG